MQLDFDWTDKLILIAEDEPANFLFIQKILQPTQVKILRAFNGQQAVELVSKTPDIDLVLMDIYMPELDGYDATRQIRAINPKLPVIAQTCYEKRVELEKVDFAMFDEFIRKPININKLLVVMQKYLNAQGKGIATTTKGDLSSRQN